MNQEIVTASFIFVLSCLLASTYVFYCNWKQGIAIFSLKNDCFSAHFIGWIISFVVTIIAMIVIPALSPTELIFSHKIKIVSVRDNATTTGSFVLGTGSINQTEYYSYYREWGNAYKKEKVAVENSAIFEEARTDAELVVLKQVLTSPWMRERFNVPKTGNNEGVLYEFHVPKGTIIKKFSLE